MGAWSMCLFAMRAALMKSSDAYGRYSDSATQRVRKCVHYETSTMKRAKSQSGEEIILENVNFANNSSIISSESFNELNTLIEYLFKNPSLKITIEGHTDNIPFTSRGAMESNWDLSTKRATAVVKILLENNKILPQNLTAAGKSEFVPIAPNTSVDGRAANRRIEIILSPSLDKIMGLINSEIQ